MLQPPFFDPEKSYQDNFQQGPFGSFADKSILQDSGKPKYTLFGEKVYLPFGIPAGPLLNGKYVKAALDKGFDIPVYKTVRTQKYASAPWPNVLSVQIGNKDLTVEMGNKGLVATHLYTDPIAITNSFGVPSFDPDFWQKDMAEASKYAKKGQFVVGSFQGTTNPKGNIAAYIQDFVLAAKLVKETGVKVLEANLSCPNEGTAHLLCYDTERSKKIVNAIKDEIGNTPLLIKIGYFSDHTQLQKFVSAVGKTVQGISAINTLPAKIVDEKGNQALPGQGRERSGVCGHPIQWAGIDMVQRLSTLKQALQLSYSIIGVGGVTISEDFYHYRKSGADGVMSATGAMWNPNLAKDIKVTSNL